MTKEFPRDNTKSLKRILSNSWMLDKLDVLGAVFGVKNALDLADQGGRIPDFLVTPWNMDLIYLAVKKQQRGYHYTSNAQGVEYSYPYYDKHFKEIEKAYLNYVPRNLEDPEKVKTDLKPFKEAVAGLLSAIAAD